MFGLEENTMPFAIKTILELIAILALLYGYCKEDKVIAFEDRFFAAVKARRAQQKKTHTQQHSNTYHNAVKKEQAVYVAKETRAKDAAAARKAAAALAAAEQRQAQKQGVKKAGKVQAFPYAA